MRGKLLFALLFALCLAAGMRLLGQAQVCRAALPMPARLAAPRALPPEDAGETAEEPGRPLPADAAASPLPVSAEKAPAVRLYVPYYRAAWEAFPPEGDAG